MTVLPITVCLGERMRAAVATKACRFVVQRRVDVETGFMMSVPVRRLPAGGILQ